ncbi:MAG: purine-nucleoside phosphorylase [Planctomycetota bacterium]|nr:purine-nucleoside phosphorylase [Planctomycetota bacterium]
MNDTTQELSSQESNGEIEDKVHDSIVAIQKKSSLAPRVGIILGSGLGDFTNHITQATSIPYCDIPFFPKLSAAGHAGELILGHFDQIPIVAMRGRSHLYEGHDPLWATYGVRVMKALGIDTLIVSNAAGGLNPRFAVGDVVLIDSHIDMMFRSGLTSNHSGIQVADMGIAQRLGKTYDESLIVATLKAAKESRIAISRGTYLATLGPTYETRAEYRAFRMLGADMVGMSTVPETILAAAMKLRVLAFSVITNVAAPDITTATSHDEVLVGAATAQAKLVTLLGNLFSQWSAPSA